VQKSRRGQPVTVEPGALSSSSYQRFKGILGLKANRDARDLRFPFLGTSNRAAGYGGYVYTGAG
jgi:hypothetical protein